MANHVETQEEIVPAERVIDNDNDSAVGSLAGTSLTSVRSSIFAYQEENGRTYHSLSAGKYFLPNDDSELERLDIQHNCFMISMNELLALCPKNEGANRVLDIGTGTGIWAIEYADRHPEAEVIGVDLSPTQPPFVPANCSFEIDDIEKDWTWSKKFDFIHCRNMTGSFADPQAVFQQAYDNLEPGGYLEVQDLSFPLRCDDGSFPEDSALGKATKLQVEAAGKMGRPLSFPQQYDQMLEKAGFTDIRVKIFKWPINQWPRDQRYKTLGLWTLAATAGGLEGLLMALFTRALGWSQEETLAFCVDVRKDMYNLNHHAYWAVYAVYGKKPEAPKRPILDEET